MREMFERDRDFFDPMPRSEWTNVDGTAQSTEELEQMFGEHAIVTEFVLYFFKDKSPRLRTDPWLIGQVEHDVRRVVKPGYEDGVKVLDIPDDVKWYLRAEDDGSESIHEEHRIWQ
jgi:hypothetical protein